MTSLLGKIDVRAHTWQEGATSLDFNGAHSKGSLLTFWARAEALLEDVGLALGLPTQVLHKLNSPDGTVLWECQAGDVKLKISFDDWDSSIGIQCPDPSVLQKLHLAWSAPTAL